MSRSYKRFTVCKDRGKGGKTRANRRVRRSRISWSGKSNAYRRLFESWDICDYRFVETKKSVVSEYEQDMRAYENGQRSGNIAYLWKKRNRSLKERLNHWAKYYYRK